MDLNQLNAKLLKAEMKGDQKLVDEYRKKIEDFKNGNLNNNLISNNQSNNQQQQQSTRSQINSKDELNILNSKLLKAEMKGDEKLVDEYRKKIEEFKNNQNLSEISSVKSNQKSSNSTKINEIREEMNQLSAKKMKAEFKNDQDLIKKYETKIEELKKELDKLLASSSSTQSKNEKSMDLTKIDELNLLNSKLLKAELRGDQKLIDEYKKKIEEIEGDKMEIDEKTSAVTNRGNNYYRNNQSLELKDENLIYDTQLKSDNNELNSLNAKLIKARMLGNKELIKNYEELILEAKQEKIETEDKEIKFVASKINLTTLFDNLAKAQRVNDSRQIELCRDKLTEFEYKFNFKEPNDLTKLIELCDQSLIETVRMKEEEEMNGNLTAVKDLDKRAKLIRKRTTIYKEKLTELNKFKKIVTQKDKPKREQTFDLSNRVHPKFQKANYEEIENERKKREEEERKRQEYLKKSGATSLEEMFEKNRASTSGIHNRPTKTINVIKKFQENTMSLKQMFVSERNSSTQNDNMRFINAASKIREQDDEYESNSFDGNKRKKMRSNNEYRYVVEEDEDEECDLCLNKIKQNLIVTFDDKLCLLIPNKEPLINDQLIIRSVDHSPSLVLANEDVINQVNQFKQKLCLLFNSLDKKRNLIFIETYFKRFSKWNRHFEIYCYPIDSKFFEESKMYFKKGIIDSEGEWAINKKLIFLDNEKQIHRMVPKELSYFSVTFGTENEGFAHVIEDEKKFPKHFGAEIIGGMFDIESQKWIKPKLQSYEEQCKRSEELKKLWSRFDVKTN